MLWFLKVESTCFGTMGLREVNVVWLNDGQQFFGQFRSVYNAGGHALQSTFKQIANHATIAKVFVFFLG
jgi:hypothetical protein